MARPSTEFTWATTPPTSFVASPPSALRVTGLPPGSVYNPPYLNALLGEIEDWLGYLAVLSPSSDRLDIGRIVGVGDPVGSGAGLFVTTSSGRVHVQPPVNEDVRVVTTGTGGLDLTVAGASAWTFGGALSPQFNADTTWTFGAPGTPIDWTILCFGTITFNAPTLFMALTYADAATPYTIHASMAQGGYLQLGGLALGLKLDTDRGCEITGTAGTFLWRRPLHIQGVPDGLTASVPAHVLASFKARVKVGNSGSSLTLRVIELTTPGTIAEAETVKASITISATTTYETLQTGTVHDSTLDPLKQYAIEIEAVAADPAHVLGVQVVEVNCTKGSVE